MSAGAAAASSGGDFILSVNDDAATRYMLSRILGRAGYRVVDATTGLEALELATRRPMLIVLDIRLPDISGLDVCRRLKARPDTAAIPVLQTSATFVSPERRVEGLDSGADGYLAQPIEPPELIATVRALLRTSRAEQSVREAAGDWQRTFDAIGEPVALFDARGGFIRGNQAFSAFVSGGPEPVTSFERLARERLCGTALRPDPHARVSAEATCNGRCYRLTIDPVNDVADPAQSTRYVFVCTDLTETKRLEDLHRKRAEELGEANRRKDEFLAMLAHELRNPLNAISAAVALHDRISGKDDRAARLRTAITRQTKNLARLVDDLLDVSRITRGRIQLKKEVVDLGGLVRSVATASQPLLDVRRQALSVALPEGPLPVEVDVLRIEQAVMNLLANASKFSELGARIALGVAEKAAPGEGGRSVEISVEDRGVGISPENLDSVFELFNQVDPTLVRSRGGLGIGLTISRSLVRMHGGSIRAHSDGLGKGARFTVTLPLTSQANLSAAARLRAADGVAAAAAAAAAEGSGATTRAVLIIEDDHDTADVLRELIGEMGHRAAVAYDGSSGLAAALNGSYDVAFVDIGLPAVDGYEIARTLRASGRFERTLLVAVTGYGQPQDRARALEAGFDLHIVKPLQPEQLAAVFARRELQPAN